MKRKLTVFILAICSVCVLYAGEQKSVKVNSPSMEMDINVMVITPDDLSKPVPVIYLLHGYGGHENMWPSLRKDLPKIADRCRVMFVCPDGKNSWYWDAPANPSLRYETFISKELISFVDSNYNTIAARTGRAITGLSMGGQGALWNAFNHPDVFGAAGSTSGGVDIRPFPKNWEMNKLLGEQSEYPERWEKQTLINNTGLIKNGDLALIIDCGYDDFFFDVNNAFHSKLLKEGINHDYIVRPGAHDGEYWHNSILYQILFFTNYFNAQ
ncbi:MAG: esterase family protein [Tannerellaceae bacterium]|nr:esterase family protein [Tannerellaceae bacterium]